MSEIIAFRPELRVSATFVDALVYSQRATELPDGWFRSKRDAWLHARDRLLQLSDECQKKAGHIRQMLDKEHY